jgi:hypothetical protein
MFRYLFFITLVLSTYSKVLGQPILRFCFPFDGNGVDQGSYNYFASPNNRAIYVADRNNKPQSAIQLDGLSQSILLNKPIPDQNKNTLMSWVKLPTTNGGGTLFSDADVPSGNDLLWDIDNSSIGIRCDKAPSRLNIWPSGISFNTTNGQWLHVAWQNSGLRQKVFINGNKIYQIDFRGENIGYHARRPSIGSLWLDDSLLYRRYSFFNGVIDDFRMYDDTLSESQIRDYYRMSSFNSADRSINACGFTPTRLLAPPLVTREWRNASGRLLGTDSVLVINSTGTNSDTVTFTGTHPLLCTPIRTMYIINHIPNQFTITERRFIRSCKTDSVVLLALPADRYVWNTGETGSQISTRVTGTFSATRTVAGCGPLTLPVYVAIANTYVNPDYLPASITICEQLDSVPCRVPDSVAVFWVGPRGDTIRTCSFIPPVAGRYKAFFTQPGGCSHSETLSVNFLQTTDTEFDFEIGGKKLASDTVDAFVPVTVRARARSFLPDMVWERDGRLGYDSTYALVFREGGSGTVSLTVTNRICAAPKSRTITVKPIVIPNIITTSLDGLNDTWPLPPFNKTTLVAVALYNAWGRAVYSGGRIGPEVLSTLASGTYYYRVELEALEAKKTVTGWVEVVK